MIMMKLSLLTVLASICSVFSAGASAVEKKSADDVDEISSERGLLRGGDHRQLDHSWKTNHWATSTLPITFSLGDNLDDAWKPALVKAAASWHASTVMLVSVRDGTKKNGSPRSCNPDRGNIEVCNYNYGDTQWFGRTSISIEGGHIVDSYVKLND
jgi:hypothetical protein